MHSDHSVLTNACSVKRCSCFNAVTPSAFRHASSKRSPTVAYAQMTNACRMPPTEMMDSYTARHQEALLALCPLLLKSLRFTSQEVGNLYTLQYPIATHAHSDKQQRTSPCGEKVSAICAACALQARSSAVRGRWFSFTKAHNTFDRACESNCCSCLCTVPSSALRLAVSMRSPHVAYAHKTLACTQCERFTRGGARIPSKQAPCACWQKAATCKQAFQSRAIADLPA